MLVPRADEADLDDLPPELRERLEIVLVDDVGTVLREAIPDLARVASPPAA